MPMMTGMPASPLGRVDFFKNKENIVFKDGIGV